MKKVIVAMALVIMAAGSMGAAFGEPPLGFTPLFNGKDLSGWVQDGNIAEHWTVVDGVLTYDGKAKRNLVTERNYRNFIMTLRWKIAEKGDSGVYLRGQPQVQIWDNPIGSGGLFNDRIDPRVNADRPIGEWNHMVIIMRGKKVTVVLNGIQVIDRETMNSIRGMPDEGPIELQCHGDPLWFKDIYIRELPG